MARKNVTTPAPETNTVQATTLPPAKGVTVGQVEWVTKDWLTRPFDIVFDLPQVEVTEAHRLAAEAHVASFKEGWLDRKIAEEPAKARAEKREPRSPDGVREKILAAFAYRFAMAEALTGLGHTSDSFREAVKYTQRIKNKPNMSSRRKAEEVLRRLKIPGAYRPRETALAVPVAVPVSRGLTGPSTAGIAGRSVGRTVGLIAAEPAPAAEPSSDPIARLLRLKEAKDLGLVDEAEYMAARAAIVALL